MGWLSSVPYVSSGTVCDIWFVWWGVPVTNTWARPKIVSLTATTTILTSVYPDPIVLVQKGK